MIFQRLRDYFSGVAQKTRERACEDVLRQAVPTTLPNGLVQDLQGQGWKVNTEYLCVPTPTGITAGFNRVTSISDPDGEDLRNSNHKQEYRDIVRTYYRC